MRRKTIAKRILSSDNDEDEEHPKYEDNYVNTSPSQVLCHRLSKKRKQLLVVKENGEEITPCDFGPQKLKASTFELSSSSGRNSEDEDTTLEVVGSLQSCSKAELVTMVLSMQREMDGLREQIQCLTACGKLARHLEGLVEMTGSWFNHGGGLPSPSMLRVLAGNRLPTPLATPPTMTKRWVMPDALPQHSSGQCVVNGETSESNGTPFNHEFITAELLDRCNTGTTAQKLTNDLLRGLYDRERLASHSISGIINSKKGQAKPALPALEVQAILRAVQLYFPGKTDAEIKGYIRQKLQNEAKRLRKKPHTTEEVGGV